MEQLQTLWTMAKKDDFHLKSWVLFLLPQVGWYSDCPLDQQSDPQPPFPPAKRPPPPRPCHVRLFPPVSHFCLHPRFTGCLTSAPAQVKSGKLATVSHPADPESSHYTNLYLIWYDLRNPAIIFTAQSANPLSKPCLDSFLFLYK